MLFIINISGLTLAFIGSFISLLANMTSKYKKEGFTYDELVNLGAEFKKLKKKSIVGFSFMAVGFLLQILYILLDNEILI